MPKICAIQTATPQYRVGQSQAKEFARRLFAGRIPQLERLLPLFESTEIKNRYFCQPLDWFSQNHSLPEKNHAYIHHATDLCTKASQELLDTTDTAAEKIDYIIYINTTGLATPSIDARLINTLNLRRNVRRTPVWGLGCAGGAAGLSHAFHYLRCHCDHRVLLVAAEFCGLTFLPDDAGKSNLVAAALFGDGVASALIVGDEVECEGLEIIDTRSVLYPDSLDVMGWNIVSEGLQVVFAQRIPEIVEQHAGNDLSEFTRDNGLGLKEIDQFLFHPGGSKVLAAYEQALGLSNGKLDLCRETLREYGNMSSVTVLFVIERYIRQYGFGRGRFGLVSALGPGFCAESLLLRL